MGDLQCWAILGWRPTSATSPILLYFAAPSANSSIVKFKAWTGVRVETLGVHSIVGVLRPACLEAQGPEGTPKHISRSLLRFDGHRSKQDAAWLALETHRIDSHSWARARPGPCSGGGLDNVPEVQSENLELGLAGRLAVLVG